MNQTPEIHGQRILLRQPLEKDIIDRFSCGRTSEIVRMYGGDTRNLKPFTQEDVQRWFEKIISQPLEWVVEYENKCIGNVRLSVDAVNRCARYAIGIFDILKLGLGIGTEVTMLVLDYAFNTLKLHRVDLVVLEYNKRAISCYAKCGFTIEGRERENALIEDKWETDVHMSILESEYRQSATTNNNSEYRLERDHYYIDTEKLAIDFAFTHNFISQKTWWGKDRSVEKMQLAIEYSLCFGLYECSGEAVRQIGFARVVTDYSSFAYIADVFVVPEQRGKGLGKWLVEAIINHPQLCELRRITLFTRTPEFYQPLGFADYRPGPEVSNFMVRTPQKASE